MSQEKALLQLGQLVKKSDYRFTTSTPLTHARVNARDKNRRANNLRDVFGWSQVFSPEVLPEEIWRLMNEAGIVEKCEGDFKSTLRISSLDDDLFFHSAYPTTQSDAVFFGPDTYRFAGAIQHWAALHQCSGCSTPRRIVDIGTGSGAGAIVAARCFPEADIFAGDINETALRLCRVNAQLAGIENIKTGYSDLLGGFEGGFDLILANPPYLVDASARAYRHGGGDLGEGLSLQIVEAALLRLNGGGSLLLYTGTAIVEGQDVFYESIGPPLHAAGLEYSYREVDPDVFGEELENGIYQQAERIAVVVLTVQKR